MRDCILYPDVSPPADDLLRLAVYLPGTRVLALPGAAPPDLTEGLKGLLEFVEPALPERAAELLRRAEASYRELVHVFGDARSLANIKGHLWTERGLEGEYQIIDEVRGSGRKLDEKEKELVESLIFVKLAREYDRTRREMESDLKSLEALEDMLKESLGPDSDYEPDALPKETDEDLLIPMRLKAFLRLLPLAGEPGAGRLMVSLRHDVHQAVAGLAREELSGPEPESLVLTTVPDTAGLNPRQVEFFLESAGQRGVMERFTGALGRVLEGMLGAEGAAQDDQDAVAAISGEIATIPPLASQRADLVIVAAAYPFEAQEMLRHLFLGGPKPGKAGSSVFLSLGPAPPREAARPWEGPGG